MDGWCGITNEQVASKHDYNCVGRGGNNVVYVLGSSKMWMIDVKSFKCYMQLMGRGGDSVI